MLNTVIVGLRYTQMHAPNCSEYIHGEKDLGLNRTS